MLRLTLTAALICTASPILAERPAGWEGALLHADCDPDRWTEILGAKGNTLYWNNPTCISVSGGSPWTAPESVTPPDGDDDDTPDDDTPDDDDPPVDPPKDPKPPKKPKDNKGGGNGDEGDCKGKGCVDPDNPGKGKK